MIHQQSTVKKYLCSHFPPAFLYPVDSIISQPLLRGIARSLLFIGPAHKLNSTESIEQILVLWLEPIELQNFPKSRCAFSLLVIVAFTIWVNELSLHLWHHGFTCVIIFHWYCVMLTSSSGIIISLLQNVRLLFSLKNLCDHKIQIFLLGIFQKKKHSISRSPLIWNYSPRGLCTGLNLRLFSWLFKFN